MAKAFIPIEEIEKAARTFLEKFHPENTIPIPIEEIIDIKMDIHIVPTPGMMEVSGVDAVTSHDLTQINIDKEQFDQKPNRARFTLAHEVGHIILHRDFIASKSFSTKKEWQSFILNDLHRDPMEVQANMFAAFVLIPSNHLEKEFNAAKKELSKNAAFKTEKLPSNKTLAPYLAKSLAQKFEVSEEAITNRLLNWIHQNTK